ncbi:MAG: hypothetical protein IPN53_14195 [Comamonadaceae bacterium]|nr:hypothetical protein [Comamonadaceae bacterium]
MTICEVYVGDLKDPKFKWQAGNWNGNLPARLSPVFPALPGNYNRTYEAWVTKVGVLSKQADFGGQVAKVTKLQILDFIASSYTREDSPEMQARIHDLTQFVNSLDECQPFALVATEW